MVTFDRAADLMAGQETSHVDLWARRKQSVVQIRERMCRHLCGEHWVVRSEAIQIQAQYSDRESWMTKFAISGTFMQNHTLIIDEDGKVTWDGKRVVDTFPTTFSNDVVQLKYFQNHNFQAIKKEQKRWFPKVSLRTMQITLPELVVVTLNVCDSGPRRWGNPVQFLDAFITMPIPTSGVDGHCGNANGDLTDDSAAFFNRHIRRGTWRVRPQDSIFDHNLLLTADKGETLRYPSFLSVEEDAVDGECEVESMGEALSLCRKAFPAEAGEDWLESCAVDVCAAGESMANRTLMLALQTDQILEQENQMATGSCHTCAPGDPCFRDVKWALEVGIPNGYYDDKGWAPTLDASSCFEEVQATLRAWQHDPSFAPHIGGMADQSIGVPCHSAPKRHQMHRLPYCR